MSTSPTTTTDFTEILTIITNARNRAYKAVNSELITMYYNIGEYISNKVNEEKWGNKTVEEFAKYMSKEHPDLKGFSKQNIWRMKQFYETYKDHKSLSPLVRELTWSNNLLILANAKTYEAKEFYIKQTIQENYSKRELERQIDSCLFERTQISHAKNKKQISSNKSLSPVKDTYVFEFLDVPDEYKEKDLRKSLIKNLKTFILELGKDFAFVAEEYRIQVGNTDFSIDLLFYNRTLQCLFAIELKIGKFKPEHVGQLSLYLEALDRDVKKPNENPSVGVILCTTKDDTVVEYTLSRILSPTLVSEYTLQLPDKTILEKKLKELSDIVHQEEVVDEL